MNIQYYGHSCVKITTKPSGRATEDVVFFIDPFDKETGLKPPQGQASVVFSTHDHHDHNNISAIKGSPTIIDSPGEYSVRGINAIGIDSFHDEKEGAERGHNTIFIMETENMRICHMGDLGSELTPRQLEQIDGVDILMIPIGGNYTISGKKASEIVRKIEPKIIIPIHYKMPGIKIDIADEKEFCKEMGNCPKEKVSKITLKKKDIEDKNMEIVLMKV